MNNQHIGYYVWTSEMMQESHTQEFDRKHYTYYTYLMESGKIVEAHCVSKSPKSCMGWPDTVGHGRIIGCLGARPGIPTFRFHLISAIAYGIWQSTGLTFEISSSRAIKFHNGPFLNLIDCVLTLDTGSTTFQFDLAENDSLERVIDAIRRQC